MTDTYPRIELDAHALAHDGRAVCRDAAGGRVIFVRGGLPGERLLARITHEKKRFAEAERVATLRPAPDAVPAACPHAEACGGCPLQTMPLDRQHYWKRAMLVEALTRIGRVAEAEALVAPIMPSPQTWGYRNKMTFAAEQGTGTLRLGLRAAASHTIVDVPGCRLMPQGVMDVVEHARQALARAHVHMHSVVARLAETPVATPAGDSRTQLVLRCITHAPDAAAREAVAAVGRDMLKSGQVTGFTHEVADTQIGRAPREIWRCGNTQLIENLDGVNYAMRAGDFFQVNTGAAQLLAAEARTAAALTGGETVWDVYCGVGAPGLSLAGQAKALYGVDVAGVGMAQKNALTLGVANCEYVKGDARQTPGRWPRPDVVLADPPRAGLHPEVVRHILRAKPARIVYVSCNPATLARDVALFAPEYALQRVQPVDMFPHTAHVESVSLLVRSEAARR